jgi:glycosyltransferase involved in cell wall biosynthesis
VKESAAHTSTPVSSGPAAPHRCTPAATRRLNILWLLNFIPKLEFPNGATLRYLNLTRHLTAAGHKVHLLLPDWSCNAETMDALVKRGYVESVTGFEGYRASGLLNGFSRLVGHPGWRNRILGSRREPFVRELLSFAVQKDIDVFIFGERTHLFAIEEIRKHMGVLLAALGDSYTLYFWRALKHALAGREARKAGEAIRRLLAALAEESYYPRIAHATITLSPVDKRVLDAVSGAGDRIHLFLNGVEFPSAPPSRAKIPNRIIFSGMMDFEPNYDAAFWFLEKVFPLIRARRPDVRFVIAGADPIPALRTRESEFVQVTGRVADMFEEIAKSQVYVAPMITGGGFKNKVVEALAAGTPVVGTRYAAEFLTPDLKDAVTVADSPAEFAGAVLRVLDDPEAETLKVQRAQQVLRDSYSWQARAKELELLLQLALERFSARRLPVKAPGKQ